MFRQKIINYFIILLLIHIVYGCSSALKLESSYNKNEVKIDGVQTDWTNKLKSVKGENVVVGFQNDDNNLYVCLATSDRSEMMKVLLMGLTVWLKPDNSKDIIGIRYPLKREQEEIKELRKNVVNQQDNPEEGIQRILADQDELEIINKDGKTITSMSITGQSGFEAKIGYSMRQLVYELKIPLKNDDNGMVLNTGNKKEINIEFVTNELKMPVRNFRPDDEEKGNGANSDEDSDGSDDRKAKPGRSGGIGGRRGDNIGNHGNPDMWRNFKEQMKFDINLKLADK
jgi:hypothetical protein